VYGFARTLPVSAHLWRRHLAIPMHANLTESQVSRVVETLAAAVATTRKAV
jgi:dTDP-4-amino-4,6-dideoxygalactose transaminase